MNIKIRFSIWVFLPKYATVSINPLDPVVCFEGPHPEIARSKRRFFLACSRVARNSRVFHFCCHCSQTDSIIESELYFFFPRNSCKKSQ